MSYRTRLIAAAAAACGLIATGATADELTPLEELGKNLLFDTALSTPPVQSCATCHATETGFTGPDSSINAGKAVYPGAVFTRFGNRKPPTVAYGGDSPVLYFDEDADVWVGGMFWDGRATGWTLGDPLAEQTQGPFLNPLEQNNPTPPLVCLKVAQSTYALLFEQVFCARHIAIFAEHWAWPDTPVWREFRGKTSHRGWPEIEAALSRQSNCER